jgi:hypothetical protein
MKSKKGIYQIKKNQLSVIRNRNPHQNQKLSLNKKIKLV